MPRTAMSRGELIRASELLTLYSAPTLNVFIERAFAVLRQSVSCDYVSVLYQRGGEGFLRERDSLGRSWNRRFMHRYAQLTPAVPLVLANPGVRIVATRFALPASDRELQQSPFYREVMQRQGWRHGAVLCFWSEPLGSFPIFVLTLYRRAGRTNFSHTDLKVLEALHPFIAPAITRFHQASTTSAAVDGVATALRHVSRGIVVLDWQLQIVRANVSGRRSCAEWNRTGGRRGGASSVAVPPDIARTCNELRQLLLAAIRQHADSDARCRRHVANPDRPRLTASVTAMCQAAAIAEPTFVVEFHERSRTQNAAEPATLLALLTAAEREVALVVSEGLSNDEAAERLGKTTSALKFLLHRVYAKLQVSNRARLTLLLRLKTERVKA